MNIIKLTAVVALIMSLASCSIADVDGNKYASFLGTIKNGEFEMNHDEANRTARTGIAVYGVTDVAGTAGKVIGKKSDNGVIKAGDNNALSGKLNDNATAIELERVKGLNELNLLEASKPVIP